MLGRVCVQERFEREKCSTLFNGICVETLQYVECTCRPWCAASSVSIPWSNTVFQFTFVSCFCLFIVPNKNATKLMREAPKTKNTARRNSHIFGIRSPQCNAMHFSPHRQHQQWRRHTAKMQFSRETKAFNTSGWCSSVRASNDFFVC